jgi:phosphoenolpyruvate carboxylase
VRELVRSFPFAANLLDDAEMAMAKADLEIAARYAELAAQTARDDDERSPLNLERLPVDGAAVRIFSLIEAEFRLTRDLVLHLRDRAELLEGEPALQRSIRLRNPYVDPMSLLQVELLRRWRAGDRRDDELLGALLATVQGIAAGLQNTG